MKTKNRLSPNPIIKLFHLAFKHEYQGKVYEEYGPCPYCGNEKSWAYDKKEKIFCRLITDEGFEDIEVILVRRQCSNSECRKVFYPKSPFHPGTSYSSLVVDFCLYLASNNPYNRCEKILMEMFGLQVDRNTIRLYALQFEERMKKIAGIKMFGKDLAINFLELFFGVDNVKELKKKYKLKGVESAGDETYPAIKGAKKRLKMENKERKKRGEKEKRYPDSFTTGLSYLPKLKCYSSLLITRFPFNSLFAAALMKPTEGSDYRILDGHGGYNDFRDVYGLFHKFKNECKGDKHLKHLQKNGSTKETREYLSSKYRQMEKQLVEQLRKEYPDFVDPGGKFTGAITTNCMEGGNWRVRYELRVPYSDDKSFTARAALICIRDSIYTFRYGRPEESFTHTNSSFRFEDVMSIEIKKERTRMRFELPKSEFNPLSIRKTVMKM